MNNTPIGTAPSLGQILLRQGVVSAQELENAIRSQKRTGRRLGEALVAAGACTDEDIAGALARQLGLAFVVPTAETVDRSALRRLGEPLARGRSCLPLLGNPGVVRLAVADPFDVVLTEDVQQVMSLPVVIEVATSARIQEILDGLVLGEDRLEDLLARGNSAPRTSGSPSEPELISAETVVNSFLELAVRRGATDVHVEPEEELLRVRFRIDGLLEPGSMIPKALSASVVARIKILSELDIAERRLPQDGRMSLTVDGRRLDLRVSVLPTIHGESAVMRILDVKKTVLPEEKLGLAACTSRFLADASARPHGLFLVCGPTGSGKSTTLYSLLSRVNALEKKVITVEDPVEFRMPLIRQVQAHADIGMTFAAGLRSILRQDPDVILVGEIRDLETAEIALRAAMTGHLVLSTLHSNTAIGAVRRLVDMGLDSFLVTSTLFGVLGQRLVRTLCAKCRTLRPLEDAERARLLPSLRSQTEQVGMPVGCQQCNGTGMKGRTGLHETLLLGREVRRAFAEAKTEDELAEIAGAEGFRSFLEDGQAKVSSGITTLDEIDRVVVEA